MSAYYNENDPKAAAWLRELIRCGHIAAGEVDERSITEVEPADVAGFDQCHFFAGIGGWSYALRIAGWADDRPVWTGSCPCQPFSVAGKRAGTDDKRHLWPEFARLIAQCNPSIVFGEQVASKDGRKWLAGVRLDLEGMGYGVGAADLCAAGAGAPHIRQRLYWVADAAIDGAWHDESQQEWRPAAIVEPHGETSRLADTMPAGRAERWAESGRGSVAGSGAVGGMAVANGGQSGNGKLQRSGQHGQQPQDGSVGGLGNTSSTRLAQQRSESGTSYEARIRNPWKAVVGAGSSIIHCTDGKSRRVESGTFPLAHGIPARMGRLRGYGNAIVPQVAAIFIQSSTVKPRSSPCPSAFA